jgi:hypothetical protein
MGYKKVFSTTRYQTKAQNNFAINSKEKRVDIGSRAGAPAKTAYIGKVIEQGKTGNILDYEVHCDISFPHVIGIFGSRGSGKSFDLGVFLEEIFLNAHEEGDSGIVFDIQDQFWTLAYPPCLDIPADGAHLADLARWGLAASAVPNVTVLVPKRSDTPVPGAKPFCLSPNQLAPSDWLAILELERFSPMGQALLSLLDALGAQTPGELALAISTPSLLQNFQQATVDGLRWRLDSLERVGIIDSQGVNIDDMLTPNTLSVILMRNLTDTVRGLVVGVVSRLVADRMGRAQQIRKVAMRTPVATAEMPILASRLWMVLDEAHVLVPSDGATAATEPMIDYVKRGRDAGLSLIFATQQPSAVNSKMISQVDLTITHALSFETDLSAATARMPARGAIDYEIDNEKTGALSDVIRSLSPGEAVVADASSGRAFLVKIRPRLSAHGGVSPT